MPPEPTKSQKKRLRHLAGVAHERELSKASEALLGEFRRWQAGEIDVFALSDKIHEFHDGTAREIYKLYTIMDPRFSVARALKEDILARTEVDDEVFSLVSPLAEALSSMKSE
jgi:hypothetical protein